jgi:hypothetical protein
VFKCIRVTIDGTVTVAEETMTIGTNVPLWYICRYIVPKNPRKIDSQANLTNKRNGIVIAFFRV